MKTLKFIKNDIVYSFVIFSIFLPIGCFTTGGEDKTESKIQIEPVSIEAQPTNYYPNQQGNYYPPQQPGFASANPGGENEKVVDENEQYVNIMAGDHEHFKSPSTDKREFFRVVMSSEGYFLRQIRGTDDVIRKTDLGGDQLIKEELSKFDKINYSDDGIVMVKLNGETGKVENVNFYHRVPRISELATIMRNDATRWVLEHKQKGAPKVRDFIISYKVILKNRASRSDIQNIIRNKKVKQ